MPKKMMSNAKPKLKAKTTAADEARINRMSERIFKSSKRTDEIYKGGASEMGSPAKKKSVQKVAPKKSVPRARDNMKTYAANRRSQGATRRY